jgi:protein phosphatase inhibitor 2
MNTNSSNIAPSVPVGQKRGILWDEPTISEHDLLRGTRTKITEPKTPYRPMLGIEQLMGGPSSASVSEQQARESASSFSSSAAAASESSSSSSSRRVRAKDFGMATDGLGGILAVNDPRVMSALAKHNAEINSGKHDGSEIKNSIGGGGGGKGVGVVGVDGEKDEFEKKRKAHYGNVKELLARSKKAIEEDDDDDEEDEEDKVKEEEEEEEDS